MVQRKSFKISFGQCSFVAFWFIYANFFWDTKMTPTLSVNIVDGRNNNYLYSKDKSISNIAWQPYCNRSTLKIEIDFIIFHLLDPLCIRQRKRLDYFDNICNMITQNTINTSSHISSGHHIQCVQMYWPFLNILGIDVYKWVLISFRIKLRLHDIALYFIHLYIFDHHSCYCFVLKS